MVLIALNFLHNTYHALIIKWDENISSCFLVPICFIYSVDIVYSITINFDCRMIIDRKNIKFSDLTVNNCRICLLFATVSKGWFERILVWRGLFSDGHLCCLMHNKWHSTNTVLYQMQFVLSQFIAIYVLTTHLIIIKWCVTHGIYVYSL